MQLGHSVTSLAVEPLVIFLMIAALSQGKLLSFSKQFLHLFSAIYGESWYRVFGHRRNNGFLRTFISWISSLGGIMQLRKFVNSMLFVGLLICSFAAVTSTALADPGPTATVSVAADPGVAGASTLTVNGTDGAESISLSDSGNDVNVYNNAALLAGDGCTQTSANSVQCSPAVDTTIVSALLDLYAGNDTTSFGSSTTIALTINGGNGNDSLYGSQGDDTISGGAGSDAINGASGFDTVSYADHTTPVSIDIASGGQEDAVGNDIERYVLGSGNDTFYGVWCPAPGCDVDGGPGDDSLNASDQADNIVGGSGNDTIHGYSGDDTIDGGSGNDYVIASHGNDTVNGGSGNDTLEGDFDNGSPGNDHLIGGSGVDTITSLAGDDSINSIDPGGVADAVVSCGDGTDTITADAADPVNSDCEIPGNAATVSVADVPGQPGTS
ncbi:MAG: hypothetical protein JHC87_07680, partial [Thermoleophilaceae bacterium]|nr:hypothetical protein [Thermoleophilaceae bacterium]